MPLKLPLLALTALAFALAGCGGSDTTTGGGKAAAEPEPLTKTELIAQADAICKDMQKQIDEIPSPETVEDLETAIADQMEISGPAIEELQALVPPEELADDYEKWTGLLDELQEGTGRVREAAASGSESDVQKIVEEVDTVNQEADRVGTKIGFKACAK